MDLAIPFAVLMLLWIFMDPPQRYDSPYTRDRNGNEIDHYTEKLVTLTPKITLSDAMLDRMTGISSGVRVPEGNYRVLMRFGEPTAAWCQSELGYEPTIVHDRHHVNHILFHNDDDAMHFMMRWL